MDMTGTFYCTDCDESFPDAVEVEHKASHAKLAAEADGPPDPWAWAAGAVIVAIGVVVGIAVATA